MQQQLGAFVRQYWYRIRPVLVVSIVGATLAAFVLFFANNSAALTQALSIGRTSIVLILGLYICTIFVLAWIYQLILRFCGARLSYGENFLLTSYSSIVNFFGPLQSGPGVRMVYLKKKHRVSLRSYMLATLLYYGFFATISAAFFLIGAAPWWLVLPGVVAVMGVSAFVMRLYSARKQGAKLEVTPALLCLFGLVVLLQLSIIALVYFVELRSLGHHIGLKQVLAYTGTANFSLFVSLTPGGLGFREGFLLFTRQVTGLDSATILAASVVDRVMYVTFLALLFGAILLVLGRSRLRALKAA